MNTQQTYICQSCKTAYQLTPKPNQWVNKKFCKKCHMANMERFENGPGLVIQLVVIAMMFIFVAATLTDCRGNSYDREIAPRHY